MLGEGFAFFDIIFFAMVAAFLVLRLRNVLGRRTGNERPPPREGFPPKPRDANEPLPDNVTRLPPREGDIEGKATPAAADKPPLEAGVTQIRMADPGFDPRGFVGGARQAFEMIVAAFAAGDTATLRPLLADDVFDNFAEAIRERQKAKHQLSTTLVAIREAEIVGARLEGRTAFVTVRFVTEQINVTRDADGAVVEGDPERATQVTDVWTFSRNTRSTDPNWALVETSDPQG